MRFHWAAETIAGRVGCRCRAAAAVSRARPPVCRSNWESVEPLGRSDEPAATLRHSPTLQPVADPKILKRGGRNTIYQLHPHLSQMRTTKYIPLTRKKAAFWQKIWANRGDGRPQRPPLFESATGYNQWSFRKTGTMRTPTRQAETGVWVQAPRRFQRSGGIIPPPGKNCAIVCAKSCNLVHFGPEMVPNAFLKHFNNENAVLTRPPPSKWPRLQHNMCNDNPYPS